MRPRVLRDLNTAFRYFVCFKRLDNNVISFYLKFFQRKEDTNGAMRDACESKIIDRGRLFDLKRSIFSLGSCQMYMEHF